MKRTIAVAFVVQLLLAGCTSKREICAQWEAGDVLSFQNRKENALEYRRKLGIKTPIGDDWHDARDSVTRFCKFYQN